MNWLMKKGAGIYVRCAACHQANGKGNANVGFPPLAGSEWVLEESPNWVISIILKGLMGPVEVAGQNIQQCYGGSGGWII